VRTATIPNPTDARGADPAAAGGSTTAAPAAAPSAVRHSLLEDVLGILTGTFAASLGLYLLKSSEAVTGGTAGLALLLSYTLPLPFGVIFFGVNLPFFGLAVWKKGWNFALRTGAAIALVSAMASLHPWALGPLVIDPVYGVLGGNLLAGVGLLILFRHKSSLGGFNILALLLQEKLKWRAGCGHRAGGAGAGATFDGSALRRGRHPAEPHPRTEPPAGAVPRKVGAGQAGRLVSGLSRPRH
jgi:hypothetical protein